MPVRVVTRKWPDSPHWEYDAVRLGADGFGTWVGIPKGTWIERPGAGFHAQTDQVTLVPHDDWWLATFHGDDSARPVDIYVDVATPATWDGDTVTAIDLDLDIIRGTSGRIWVDDEDEFAAHRTSLGYPDDVIEHAISSCTRVYDAITAHAAPYDGTSLDWFARLRAQAQ